MAGSTVPSHLMEKAISRFENEVQRRSQSTPLQTARVITVSRQLGSGGKRLAEALGKELGWPVWDKEILDVVASQSHLHFQARMFEHLDETAQSNIGAIAYSLLGSADKYVYLYLLPRAIRIIAHHDAIILGRGGYLVLPRALKVRVVAPHEVRVANVMGNEGLSEEAAEERIKVWDHERADFVRELSHRLGIRHTEPQRAAEQDLIINTGTFGIEESVSMILTAANNRFQLVDRSPPAPPISSRGVG